jgi:hypothetical protein
MYLLATTEFPSQKHPERWQMIIVKLNHLDFSFVGFSSDFTTKALITLPYPTQLNSTQQVELNRIGQCDHSNDPTQLNSTESAVFHQF